MLPTNFLLPDIELRWGKILYPDRTELSAEVISEMTRFRLTGRLLVFGLVTDFVYFLAGAFLILIYYRRKLSAEVI